MALLQSTPGDYDFLDDYASTVYQPDATAGIDSWINENSPLQNNEDSNQMKFGTNSANDTGHRPLLKFTITEKRITYAKLDLTYKSNFGQSSNDSPSGVYRVTADWDEPEVTWEERTDTNSWSAMGGDYDASSKAAVTRQSSSLSLSTDLFKSIVQDAVDNRESVVSIILIDDQDADAGDTSYPNREVRYYSSDHTTAGERPKLTVATGDTYTSWDVDGNGVLAAPGVNDPTTTTRNLPVQICDNNTSGEFDDAKHLTVPAHRTLAGAIIEKVSYDVDRGNMININITYRSKPLRGRSRISNLAYGLR